MYLLILPEIDTISMKETGQTLIKLILYLITFPLIEMIHLKLMKKTYITQQKSFLIRSAIYLIAMPPLKKSANIN